MELAVLVGQLAYACRKLGQLPGHVRIRRSGERFRKRAQCLRLRNEGARRRTKRRVRSRKSRSGRVVGGFRRLGGSVDAQKLVDRRFLLRPRNAGLQRSNLRIRRRAGKQALKRGIERTERTAVAFVRRSRASCQLVKRIRLSEGAREEARQAGSNWLKSAFASCCASVCRAPSTCKEALTTDEDDPSRLLQAVAERRCAVRKRARALRKVAHAGRQLPRSFVQLVDSVRERREIGLDVADLGHLDHGRVRKAQQSGGLPWRSRPRARAVRNPPSWPGSTVKATVAVRPCRRNRRALGAHVRARFAIQRERSLQHEAFGKGGIDAFVPARLQA